MSVFASNVVSLQTQFLNSKSGKDSENPIKDGTAIVVPAGTEHNVINTSSSEELKLYIIYAPPHHKDGIVHM